MFRDVQIAPSLLSADFLNLERDVRRIEQAQPEWLHVDVMDGHFVPNLTIGPPVIRALKRMTDVALDVHLMISNPAEQLDWYLEAGADLVTVHVESVCGFSRGVGAGIAIAATAPAATATPATAAAVAAPATTTAAGSSLSVEQVEDPASLIALIDRIHAAGALAGISLNPGTPASAAEPFVGLVDLILVMSVHPGFGGQSFIESSIDKIAALAACARALGADPLLEVDGGINAHTAPLVTAQGADVLVAGNAVFGAVDPPAALRAIREAARR
jgi:ribulose-phosphate 3-epimerase